MKALGNSFINTEGEIHSNKCFKNNNEIGNTMDLKSVANMKLQSDNQLSMRSGTDMLIYSMGNNIDIQNIIPLEPADPTAAVIPPAPFIVDPTPPEIALKASRVPQHEPWFEHEHYDPKKYTPDLTRAGVDLPETYPSVHLIHPNRTAGGMVVGSGNQPNAYNSSGAPKVVQDLIP